MKKYIILFFLYFTITSAVHSACTIPTCLENRDTPAAEYLFENNLNDTSGNGLDGLEYTPDRPVAYYENIGGRPGFCAGNFTFDTHTGFYLSACAIYGDEGEIEWYHYLTNPAETRTNDFLHWDNISTGLILVPGDAALFGSNYFRIGYSSWNGTGVNSPEYAGEWIKYNQWQHCSFQWGEFGTRMIIDGEVVAGSIEKFYQGSRVEPWVFIGTWHSENTGFSGYIDDLRFWKCSGHGTPTVTPTQSSTRSYTPTVTNTITETHSITPTSTISKTHTTTETETPVMTFTITETFTVTPSLTESQIPTATHTCTLTPTITNTTTASPTPSETKFFGIFPIPAKDRIKIIFSSAASCKAEFHVYTVAGEKTGFCSANVTAGINTLVFQTKNISGISLSSGIYLYRLNLIDRGIVLQTHTGSFAVIK